MKSIQLKQGLIAAAIIGAFATAPAFAADSATHSAKAGSQSTTGATATPKMNDDRTVSGRTSSTELLPCSSYKNPNAGKLADKDTGAAKEHSASPVHKDCIEDSTPTTATTNSGTSGSMNGATTSGGLSGSATGSTTGSATGGTTGSATGSTSGSLNGTASGSASGALNGSASGSASGGLSGTGSTQTK